MGLLWFNWISFIKAFSVIIFIVVGSGNSAAQSFKNVASQKGVEFSSNKVQWGCGVSFYDYNKDGMDDIVYPKDDDTTMIMYNTGQGFKRDTNITILAETQQLLWFDFDNDGDSDVAISREYEKNIIYENIDTGGFRKLTPNEFQTNPSNRTFGVTAVDFNKDGYLDLYFANYEYNNGNHLDSSRYNKLYRNNGDGTFTEVGAQVGVGDGNRTSFQGLWFDYNNDNLPDLYVINDLFYRNHLYKNLGNGNFKDVTKRAGVALGPQHPMTTSCGDFNNDGLLDVYMSNSSGASFGYERNGKFIINQGDGSFRERAKEMNVNIKKWSWGGLWIDYNNNGYQDLYVNTAELQNPNYFKNPFYVNDRGDSFQQDQSVFSGNQNTRSYAAAKGDFNDDGFYDIFVQNTTPKKSLLWENQNNSNNYVKITLEGTASNRMAIGSWIKVYAKSDSFYKYTKCGTNYMSQNSQHKIFGLGKAKSVDSVIVQYPSGHIDKYYNLNVNKHYYLKEGETIDVNLPDTVQVCKGDSTSVKTDSFANYYWNNGDTTIEASVSDKGLQKLWVRVTNEHGVQAHSDTAMVEFFPELQKQTSNVSCLGRADGKVSLQVNKSINNNPTRFIWDSLDNASIQKNLQSGVYEFTYKQKNGCEFSDSVKIGEPEKLVFQYNVKFKSGRIDSAGILEFTAKGGQPPYRFFLNSDSVGEVVNQLPTDTFIARVEDRNGCQASRKVVINRGNAPVIQVKKSMPTCNSIDNGKIFLNINTQNIKNYTVSWGSGRKGDSIKSLSAGKYVYKYSDSRGGQEIDTVKLSYKKNLSLNLTVTPKTFQHKGQIKVKVKGGIPPYQIIKDGKLSRKTMDNLSPGFYAIKAYDSEGCMVKKQVKVPDKRKPGIDKSIQQVTCHGGNNGVIKLNVDSSITKNRSYKISWSDGINGKTRKDLKAGVYVFKYTDSLGVSLTDTIEIGQPNPLALKDQVVNQPIGTCLYNLNVEGGRAPYQIRVDGVSENNPIQDLSNGQHRVKVKDANSCSLDTTVQISGSSNPVTGFKTRAPSCAASKDGSIALRLNGDPPDANEDLAFEWSNQKTGKLLTNLSKGKYVVTINTSAGCHFKDSTQLEGPYPLNVQKRVVPSENEGNQFHKIKITINGGTPPYQVILNGKGRKPPIDSLRPGVYNLKVVDKKDCKDVDSFRISDNNLTNKKHTKGQQGGVILKPNPVEKGGGFKVIFNYHHILERISVIDLRGRVLKNVVLRDGEQEEIQVKTNQIKPGLYFVRLTTKRGVEFSKKLMVR